MKDLTSVRIICLKGFLMLLGGVLAGALIIIERPTVKVAILLAGGVVFREVLLFCLLRY